MPIAAVDLILFIQQFSCDITVKCRSHPEKFVAQHIEERQRHTVQLTLTKALVVVCRLRSAFEFPILIYERAEYRSSRFGATKLIQQNVGKSQLGKRICESGYNTYEVNMNERAIKCIKCKSVSGVQYRRHIPMKFTPIQSIWKDTYTLTHVQNAYSNLISKWPFRRSAAPHLQLTFYMINIV